MSSECVPDGCLSLANHTHFLIPRMKTVAGWCHTVLNAWPRYTFVIYLFCHLFMQLQLSF